MEKTPNNHEYLSFAEEIRAMGTKDQVMRQRALENKGIIESGEDEQLDRENTDRMKEIVARIGWPTTSKVGEETSHMAWLLVQHADHDVAFQKQCLELMKSETKEEVDKVDVAYLEDRVRKNEGKPQLYGTQFHEEGEHYGPWPIEEPEKVDERRKALGLESIEEYEQALREKYKK